MRRKMTGDRPGCVYVKRVGRVWPASCRRRKGGNPHRWGEKPGAPRFETPPLRLLCAEGCFTFWARYHCIHRKAHLRLLRIRGDLMRSYKEFSPPSWYLNELSMTIYQIHNIHNTAYTIYTILHRYANAGGLSPARQPTATTLPRKAARTADWTVRAASRRDRVSVSSSSE